MRVFDETGAFAGDKDAAASIRNDYIRPALIKKNPVTVDFAQVDLATQSFIHALIASIVRENPNNLNLLTFVNCNSNVQSLIEIVVDYAQDEFE